MEAFTDLEKELAMAVLAVKTNGTLTKEDIEAIIPKLSDKTATVNAIRKRWTKLQNKLTSESVAVEGGEGSGGEGSVSKVAAAPAKKTRAPAKKKATPKSAAKAEDGDGEGENEGDVDTAVTSPPSAKKGGRGRPKKVVQEGGINKAAPKAKKSAAPKKKGEAAEKVAKPVPEVEMEEAAHENSDSPLTSVDGELEVEEDEVVEEMEA